MTDAVPGSKSSWTADSWKQVRYTENSQHICFFFIFFPKHLLFATTGFCLFNIATLILVGLQKSRRNTLRRFHKNWEHNMGCTRQRLYELMKRRRRLSEVAWRCILWVVTCTVIYKQSCLELFSSINTCQAAVISNQFPVWLCDPFFPSHVAQTLCQNFFLDYRSVPGMALPWERVTR